MNTKLWPAVFVLCWSSGFVGTVLAARAGSVAGVLAWRYVVTALVLLAVVVVRRRGWPGRADLVQQAAMGLLAHVVFLGGVFVAADRGLDAGTAALVCALQPMLVTVAGRVWWGDAVRRRQVVGLLVGLVAVLATVGGAGGGSPSLLVWPVVALVGLSGSALVERRRRPRVDVVTSLFVQVVVAAAVFTAYAALTGQLAISMTGSVLGALGWLVVLSGLGGYSAFVLCLRTLGGTTTSLLLYLTPPVTTLWAWAMFAQDPTPAQWLGLALGAGAVALAWPRRTAPERARNDAVAASRTDGAQPGTPVGGQVVSSTNPSGSSAGSVSVHCSLR